MDFAAPQEFGGKAAGTCASGFGVCCVLKVTHVFFVNHVQFGWSVTYGCNVIRS